MPEFPQNRRSILRLAANGFRPMTVREASIEPGQRIPAFRLEDDAVPIKLVHKMSERQVILEMAEFKEMEHDKTIGTLPWQHIVVFQKKVKK